MVLFVFASSTSRSYNPDPRIGIIDVLVTISVKSTNFRIDSGNPFEVGKVSTYAYAWIKDRKVEANNSQEYRIILS